MRVPSTVAPLAISQAPALRAQARDAAHAGYRAVLARRTALLALLLCLLAASFVTDVVTGSSGLSVADLLQVLLHPGSLDRTTEVIVWNVRLPYGVMAVLVGAALGLAGAEMQTVLDNPLASPFTLGVSSAAALGASLAIVFRFAVPGLSYNGVVAACAFVFACASVFLLQLMSRLRGAGVESLVLFGIALVFSCNAAVAMLQLVATEDVLQQLVFWTLGNVARATWDKVGVLAAAFLLVLPFSLRASWRLTALRLGEDRARSFGVDVKRLRVASLLRISLLASFAVAFVGPIGFIGLVGPHMARLCVGEDQRFLLPASATVGALLLSLSSIASKLILPGVIVPVGIVTALVGVPVFVVLVFSRGGRA